MFDAISIPSRLTWSAGQVAQTLGISETTFLKKRAELEKSYGFPGKLPGFNKWSQWAVVHWISTNGGTYAVEPARPVANGDPEIEAFVAGLESEYTGAGAEPDRAVA